MSFPTTHRALKVVDKGKVELQTVPLPAVRPNEVLVRVHAVALNPTDWKHIDSLLKPGASIGCDFAGVVVVADKESGLWNVGDEVAGFVRGGFVDAQNGAFQEYVTTLPQSLWRKPKSLSFEDAAPMGGIALSTAAQALFHRFTLSYTTPLKEPKPILIWSGATGVGMYAIILAALAGYKVVTTCSPRNFELVKSLGASAAFPYSDPETPTKIKQWAESEGLGPITWALDTISENGSTEAVVKALREDENSEVITLLPVKFDTKVKINGILIYSALKPKNERDFKLMYQWNQDFPGLIEAGKIPKVPLKVFSGGLEGLEEAIDYVRQGKVSGQKVVVPFVTENLSKL